ncbi:MAG: shikimate dehydrogenase [Lachnospira sp.]
MIEIKGTTSVYGLIGNPVEHSVSPVIHNTLAELLGIDMVYATFKVEKDLVADAVKGAAALNVRGMNVTVPHKQSVMNLLTDIDPLAKAIGAVNTLVRAEDGYKGYNTDILGLERELEDVGVELRGNRCIILGAGGASRAIAFLCASKGAEVIYLLNRTISKAEDIAAAVNSYIGRDVVIPMAIDDYKNIPGIGYLTIQTTSVGLYPACDSAPADEKDFYDKVSIGVDIIYNPAETKFMKYVKAQGKPAYNGLKMLLYQGVCAFELWNKVSVSREITDVVYEKLEKELQ